VTNSNRRLTIEELEKLARPLLEDVRNRLVQLSAGDLDLQWALRRKLYKELIYDERGKPMYRRALKELKRKEQDGLCVLCRSPLPKTGAVLDRLKAMNGYTAGNTHLLCPTCDTAVQTGRGYS
jgi:hypothetical protein